MNISIEVIFLVEKSGYYLNHLSDYVAIYQMSKKITNYLSYDTSRNIQIYENLISSGVELSPRDLFYYGNELLDHGKFEEAIEYYIKFLNTKQGWVEDNNKIADCYNHLGLKDQELTWVLNTLSYAAPRPETCCRLGFYFIQNEYKNAVYRYKQAIENKENDNLPFKNHTCSTWLPHLQLAVCYEKLGQYQLGSKHIEESSTQIR